MLREFHALTVLLAVLGVSALGAASARSLAAVQEVVEAIITNPADFVPQNLTGNTSITLDAAAFSHAGLKVYPIQRWDWEVRSMTANGTESALLLTATGRSVELSLPTGAYNVALTIRNSDGRNSTGTKAFAIGGGKAGGVESIIASPSPWVPVPPGSPRADIVLDATGTKGTNGSTLTQFAWTITSVPGQKAVANATGAKAKVALGPGSYQAALLVVDSKGNSAVAKKDFTVRNADGGADATAKASAPALASAAPQQAPGAGPRSIFQVRGSGFSGLGFRAYDLGFRGLGQDSRATCWAPLQLPGGLEGWR